MVSIPFRRIVRLIAEQRSGANAQAARIRKAQKQRGLALDTRADYAEGSAAAYTQSLAIIAAVMGVPLPDLIAAAEQGDD